jgi:histone-lysine N-methyltransferase ASH1L
MALFAGDNPIMTGDELTYDYNFDPFSAKNVQECRCGSDNCRGILGPRPKDLKPLKETIKEAMKAGVKAGKRKLKELLVGSETDEEDGDVPSPKKRKAKETKGLKRGASKLKKAKGAANIVKKTVSSQLFKTSRTVSTKRGAIVVKKTIGKKIIKTYGKSQSKSTFSKGSTTGVKSKASVKISKKSSGVSKNTVRKNTSKNMRGIPKGSRGPCPEGTIEVISNPGGHFEDEDDDMYEDEDDEE